jgi:hypothetical protein
MEWVGTGRACCLRASSGKLGNPDFQHLWLESSSVLSGLGVWLLWGQVWKPRCWCTPEDVWDLLEKLDWGLCMILEGRRQIPLAHQANGNQHLALDADVLAMAGWLAQGVRGWEVGSLAEDAWCAARRPECLELRGVGEGTHTHFRELLPLGVSMFAWSAVGAREG